jgi:hypothetical protein
VSLRRTPTPAKAFFCSFFPPAATVTVASIPRSGCASLESAITEERKAHEFVPSPTRTLRASLPAHFRLQLSPKTLWKALTSSCVWKA